MLVSAYFSDFGAGVAVEVLADDPSAFALQQDFPDFSPEHAFASVFSPEHAFPSCSLQHAFFSSFFFLSSPFLSSPFTVTTAALLATNVVADAAPTIPVNANNKNN